MAKVLLFCHDTLQESMAGPAIRYWEFAHHLAKHHQVTLFSSSPSKLQSDVFKLVSINQMSIRQAVRTHDVILTQMLNVPLAFYAIFYNKKVILDAYDPLPIESLELYKDYAPKRKSKILKTLLENTLLSFNLADRIICASNRQKDLWIGFMCSIGLVQPTSYEADPSYKKKIGIVPFGLDVKMPQKTGPGLREKFQLKHSDFVLIWGGGIWNWFDPLTAINAIHLLSKTRPEIKLVFLGTKHPNPGIIEMKMTQNAIELAKSLGIIDEQVFFNFGWVPYKERHNYLLDAQAGISCHFDNLETKFSFRTRILDYLWAGLPIVTSEGDFFANLVENKKLGKVVPVEQPEALASAILEIADNEHFRNNCKDNILSIRTSFSWDIVTAPIIDFVADMEKSPMLPRDAKRWKTLFKFGFKMVKEKGFFSTGALIIKKAKRKVFR